MMQALQDRKLSDKSATILRMLGSNRSYDQVLLAYPGWTYSDIAESAREALALLGEPKSTYHERILALRRVSPRAYEKWTGEEEATLTQLFYQGMSIQEIADRLKRRAGGITARLGRLGLIPPGGRRSQSPALDPAPERPSAGKHPVGYAALARMAVQERP